MMRPIRARVAIGVAVTLAFVLVGGLLGAASAGTQQSGQTTAAGQGAVAQRVGTTDVRAIAAKGARAGAALSGARTPDPAEFGAWISEGKKEEATGSGSSGPPRPSPRNRALVSRENHRGWEGLDHTDQRLAAGGNQFSLEPPDQGLCVGNVSPNGPEFGPEVVESVNDALTFYDASSNQFTPAISLSEFYGLPPTIDRTTGTFGPFVSDPKCYFDADTQRWFHTVLVISTDPTTGDLQAPSFVYFAVSTSAEALGSYFIYRIDATNPQHPNCPCFGDQPLLGADKYGFYISTAEYDLDPFGGNFNGPQIYAFSKAALEAGSIGPVVHLDGLTHVVRGRTTGTVQPAISPDSAFETANNGTEYFLSAYDCLAAEACAIAPGQFNKITIWALTNTQSLTTASPDVHLSLRDLTSEVYGTPVPQRQRPGPRPLGSLVGEPLPVVEANDSRMNQVVFADGLLWSGLNTIVAPGPRDGIAFFIVRPSVSGGQVGGTIRRQGYVAVAGAFLSFPSVGVNGAGRGVVAMSLMGPRHFPSAAQIDIDRDGVSGPVEIVRSGFRPEDGFTCYEAFVGENPVCRWGDYSASIAGPDGTIYSATEFIGDNSRTVNANWSTFIWPKER
jgi:hypothetical protein